MLSLCGLMIFVTCVIYLSSKCGNVRRFIALSLSPPPLEIDVEVLTLLNLARVTGIGIMTAVR